MNIQVEINAAMASRKGGQAVDEVGKPLGALVADLKFAIQLIEMKGLWVVEQMQACLRVQRFS